MDTRRFTALLARPQDISEADVEALNAIVETYPFFQSARALQLKGLKNAHSYLYNDALKRVAAYTTDRDVLFDYITSEAFDQNEISEIIQQNLEAIKEIPVVSEDISEQISKEIDDELKAERRKAEAILRPDFFERKEDDSDDGQTQPETFEQDDLGITKPLEFTKDETHSFAEWLKLTKASPIEREHTEPSATASQPKPITKKFALIDKFIQHQPKLKPKDTASPLVDLSEPYTHASDKLMTETLAKVYLQQKNYKKAIQAYKILILKNPEKSGFFADQIRAIEKLIKE